LSKKLHADALIRKREYVRLADFFHRPHPDRGQFLTAFYPREME